MRAPDFFVVGHPKCGTTALYGMLSQHPDIYMLPLKEPDFFCPDIYTPRVTANAYDRLFDGATENQLVGEASPLYLVSHLAPELIAKVNSRAKIVALFREPSSFIRSLHFQYVSSWEEPITDLRHALDVEPERRQGRQLPRGPQPRGLYFYSEYLHYADQLSRFRNAFSSEQVLPIIYEEFRADNDATIRQIFNFLEIDASVKLRQIHANPSVGKRSARFNSIRLKVRMTRGPAKKRVGAMWMTLPLQVRSRLLRTVFGSDLPLSPPPVDKELMGELRDRFAPEVARLGNLLERDLEKLWGNPTVV